MKQLKAKQLKAGMEIYLQFDHAQSFPLTISEATFIPKGPGVRSAHVIVETQAGRHLFSANLLLDVKV